MRSTFRGMAMQALVLLAACLWLVGVPAQAQDELKDAATALVADVVKDVDAQKLKGQQLVIAEFQNINGRGDALTKILQEKLTTAFIKAKHFKVVERAQLEKAMKELKIDATGLTDPQYRKDLGKLVGAAYMLVGSLSEARGVVSVDCRLVAIETGESVTAADVTIAGGAPANPPVNPTGTGGNPTTPPVGVNTPANPSGTGTYLGKPENGGLLGGAKFSMAWREVFDPGKGRKVVTFCAGDIRGDGTPRLATLDVLMSWYPYSYSSCSQTSGVPGFLRIWGWRQGKFAKTWEQPVSAFGCERGVVRAMPKMGKVQPISIANINWGGNTYVWNGTTYVGADAVSFLLDRATCGNRPIVMWDRTRDYRTQVGLMKESAEPFAEDPAVYWEAVAKGDMLFGGKERATAADLDGDGKVEVAMSATGEATSILDEKGKRKTDTDGTYDRPITVWQPAGAKLPYLVLCRNDVKDEAGKKTPIGGTVFLLQWDGEVYQEVWKSDRMGDEVWDVQVCDPKAEGKESLVVLSTDAKGSYLTRIVAE